jgi:hypothetical protein
MSQTEDLGSFFQENKALLKEYLETRLEIYRLQGIRIASKAAGYLAWVVISLFLLFLILLFSGIVLGCWLSGLTHSYTAGFGITTGVLIIIFAFLALLRKSLFVNPLTQNIIRKTNEDFNE